MFPTVMRRVSNRTDVFRIYAASVALRVGVLLASVMGFALRRAGCLVSLVVLTGCGGASNLMAGGARASSLTTPEASTDATVQPPASHVQGSSPPATLPDDQGQLAVAEHHLRAQRYAAVLELATPLFRSPSNRVRARARYLAALAEEGMGRHGAAAQHFQSLFESDPSSEYATEARVRASRLFVFLSRWREAEAAVATLRLEPLSPLQAVAVLSARALGRLDAGDLDGAEHAIGRGRRVVETTSLDGAGVLPRDIAQLYFALAELRRRRGEGVRFDPLPEDFAARFEQRAQWLLDAQAAYSDVMRANDAHWTAIAGFRLGGLYQGLHRDVMAMPLPQGLVGSDRRDVFLGAMRLRYSVLLRKGLNVFEHTLAMAERTGEQSEWVARTRAARDELAQALLREEQALDALPYSREDLRRVLVMLRRDALPGARQVDAKGE